MALGLGELKQKVLVLIDSDANTAGVNKMKAAISRLRNSKDKARGLAEALGNLGAAARGAGDDAERAEKSFSELTGQGLNLLFTGMALLMVFGLLTGGMLRFIGVAEPLAQMFMAALLPAFMMLVPHLLNIAESFNGLSKRAKTMIGIFLLLLGPVGLIVTLIGALLLASTALSVGLVGLVSVISIIIATMIALAAFLTLLAERKFPILNNAVDAAAKFFAGVWERAFETLKQLVDGFMDIFRGDFIKGLKKINGAIFTAFLIPIRQAVEQFNLIEAAKSLGQDIIDGIVSAIQGAGNFIGDAISSATGINLPNIGGVLNGIGEAVGDLVITSGGRVFKTASRDGLIATPNAQRLAEGGGGGGQTTVNINDPVIKDEMDLDRVVDQVEDRINRDTRGRSNLP